MAFEAALLREIRRMRKLLELEPDAYSDLQVLARAREELQEVIDDDRIEQDREDELMDDERLEFP